MRPTSPAPSAFGPFRRWGRPRRGRCLVRTLTQSTVRGRTHRSRVYAKDLTTEACDAHFEAAMAHPVAADRFGNYLEAHGAAAHLQFWLEMRVYRTLTYGHRAPRHTSVGYWLTRDGHGLNVRGTQRGHAAGHGAPAPNGHRDLFRLPGARRQCRLCARARGRLAHGDPATGMDGRPTPPSARPPHRPNLQTNRPNL